MGQIDPIFHVQKLVAYMYICARHAMTCDQEDCPLTLQKMTPTMTTHDEQFMITYALGIFAI